MERTVTKEYKIITTEKYCGDDENGEECPQLKACTRLMRIDRGAEFYCAIFFDEEGEPELLDGDNDTGEMYRCKGCLKYFNELN